MIPELRRFVNVFRGWLAGWMDGLMADWLACWLANWLVGLLVGWLVVWLTGYLAGWCFNSVSCERTVFYSHTLDGSRLAIQLLTNATLFNPIK